MKTPPEQLAQRRAFYVALGQQIQKRREELGLNRLRVADKLGIPAIKLARYEKGSSYIPAQYYYELYFMFGGF